MRSGGGPDIKEELLGHRVASGLRLASELKLFLLLPGERTV